MKKRYGFIKIGERKYLPVVDDRVMPHLERTKKAALLAARRRCYQYSIPGTVAGAAEYQPDESNLTLVIFIDCKPNDIPYTREKAVSFAH